MPLAQISSDEELIAGIAERNPTAFRLLVARYQAPIYRYACALADVREDAEDALQETFLAAFRKLLFDGNPPIDVEMIDDESLPPNRPRSRRLLLPAAVPRVRGTRRGR